MAIYSHLKPAALQYTHLQNILLQYTHLHQVDTDKYWQHTPVLIKCMLQVEEPFVI